MEEPLCSAESGELGDSGGPGEPGDSGGPGEPGDSGGLLSQVIQVVLVIQVI